MLIMDLSHMDFSQVGEMTDSIPLASAAERARYDVAKETEALYRIHLQCMRDCDHPGPPSTIHPSISQFEDASTIWWSMTGGWKNVDKRIRDKYDKLFIATVNNTNVMLPAVKAFVEATQRAAARETAAAAAASGSNTVPSARIRGNSRPFDVVGATKALYEVAQRSVRTTNAPTVGIEALFDRLASIWWDETGGPKRIDKTILDPYPSWFIGKLEMFKPQLDFAPPGMTSPPRPNFDVEKATRCLFEIAKKRYPNAPRGMKDKSSSLQLDMAFTGLAMRWCQNTGGWDRVDKAIRGQYPKWFVTEVARIDRLMPVAKVMAFDAWNKRTVMQP